MGEFLFVATEREAWLAWHGAGSGALRELNSFLNSASWAEFIGLSAQGLATRKGHGHLSVRVGLAEVAAQGFLLV